MNRPLVLTGVALSALVALTGCGGKKKAATVAESATPGRHTPAPPTATKTVGGVVRPGGFCASAGTVGKTSGGDWARCQKRSGDKRPRWYVEGAKGARAGQFCSKQGATTTSSTGTKLVCTKKSGETRPRWRKK